GIARVSFWAGNNQEAISYFKQAVQAGADQVEARLEMGKIYLAMDQKQKAAQEFQQVLKLDPNNQEAKRFLKGIHILKTVEIYPSNMKWIVYPDNSMGITLTAGITYHIKQLWDITFLYTDKVITGTHDHIFSLSALYKGIKNLYLSGEFSGTRDPDFSPLITTQLDIGYDFGPLGASFGLKADIYSNETLFRISPGLLKYFSDASYINLIFNYFSYTTGYSTSKIEFRSKLEYFDQNTINLSLVYGGDVEIKDPLRRVFDITAGTTLNITDNLEVTLSYGWIETEYGRSHQLTYESIVKW
ncbi:MAG: tetratricopeptide repeat protein, partial [Spirochaetota bacterium]